MTSLEDSRNRFEQALIAKGIHKNHLNKHADGAYVCDSVHENWIGWRMAERQYLNKNQQTKSAFMTLSHLNYTFEGGSLWKPPITNIRS